MTLRLRLFALLVALAAVLAVGEWLLVRSLSVDLEDELAAAAASVSQDVLRLLHLGGELPAPAQGPESAAKDKLGQTLKRRIFVVEDHAIVRKGPGAATSPRTEGWPVEPPALADAPEGPPGTQEARGVIERRTMGPDGTVTTERHQVRTRFEPGSAAHVLLLRGPRDAAAQRVPVPTSGVEHAIERFTRRLLLASLGLFGGALLLGVVVAHRFTRPLRDLAAAARRVGSGDLGVRAPAAPGEVGEAVAAFNQMSEQLVALDAEARRLRASEQLSELGEVGRGLAHSLRNPLNALGLALDQLAERASAAEQLTERESTRGGDAAQTMGESDAAAVAAAARRQIRRIDAALRGFLALSAADAAAVEVDVATVARDVALEALQARTPAEATARVEVTANGPARLLGVEAELRAALQALVVNAVEASPPGSPVVVTVTAGHGDGDAAATAAATGFDDGPSSGATASAATEASEGPLVTITVDDHGPGLPASVRERIFTPHVTTKAAGAGMGLYLTHRLATTRYGGSLALADRAGGGTRATLTIGDRAAPGSTGSPIAPGSVAISAAAGAPRSAGVAP